MHHEHGEEPIPGDGTLDPLLKASRESADFSAFWFKSEAKLKPVQMVGLTILSLVFVCGGIVFGGVAGSMIFSGDVSGVMTGAVALGILFVGLYGLFRIFRSW